MDRRPRPRVLAVDDHPEILRQLSAFLAADFDVVGLASDGNQAIELALRVVPDLIVLDVVLPRIDGFQVARRLREVGSPSRIVFTTMHDEEDYAVEAFRSGGWGFVGKTRLHVDLISALEHAIEGRRFIPTLATLFAIPDARHAVQFHSYDHGFVNRVGSFLNHALRRGDAVALVATPAVRAGVAERLRSYGWTVGETGDYGQYHAIDAAESLSQIMANDRPDPERLAQGVEAFELIRVASAEAPEPRLTLVGEIAVPLLLNGNAQGAMEVERLWNDLTRDLPWVGVCCYPMACFADLTDPERFRHVCAEHHAVGYAQGSGARGRHV
jgi:CheY-like chemotaxis protein